LGSSASQAQQQTWERQQDMFECNLEQHCSKMTQALEPAALDVCSSDKLTCYVLSAGPATELLSLTESE